MLDLNVVPPFDWDEFGEWEGPAHELGYDMVWTDEGTYSWSFWTSGIHGREYLACVFVDGGEGRSVTHGDDERTDTDGEGAGSAVPEGGSVTGDDGGTDTDEEAEKAGSAFLKEVMFLLKMKIPLMWMPLPFLMDEPTLTLDELRVSLWAGLRFSTLILVYKWYSTLHYWVDEYSD